MLPASRPSARSQWLAWGFVLVFLVCIGGAYAWFHSEKTHQSTIRFEARSVLAGYDYRIEPITPSEQSSLATTNLTSGTFIGTNAQEIRVFFANWNDSNGKSLSVVQHTPDICWVKAGLQPVNLGQPEKMTIQFGTANLDFECRAFETPGGDVRQLVVWSTLVGGKPFQESWRFQTSKSATREAAWVQANRFLAANQFIQSVIHRIPSERTKQFVRYSTPVQTDWQTAFETLRLFGPKWIEVKTQSP
jgi:hypothetical protein